MPLQVGYKTRLAVGLLDGPSIGEFAAAVGVSTNTAKTQLAGLFAKSGAHHRQAELIAVLRAAGCGRRLEFVFFQPV